MSDFSPASSPSAGGQPLLIVGASARAAAESARRAGYRPLAIDLFADADLAEVADVQVSRDFPYDIPALARTMPAADWIYVGGLENYPDVVDELAAERRLLGCSGDTLRKVRDPKLLRDELCRHGVMTPESIFDQAELERWLADEGATTGQRVDWSANRADLAGDWLLKRRRSSGGLGVVPCRRLDRTLADVFDHDRYLQRRVRGKALGAVYLASKSRTDFLGASYQLTCPSRDGNQPFRYAGSVGPIPFERLRDDSLDDKLNKIGSVVTSVYPLSGIFSLDFIRDAGNEIRLLEINPRYTAGCELIERCLGKSLVGLHAAACGGSIDLESGGLENVRGASCLSWHGKKVAYATSDLAQVTEDLTAELLALHSTGQERDGWATIGDIPRARASIRCDEPIATVFATGDDEESVREQLDLREHELRALIGG